jgi:hypothetical protein
MATAAPETFWGLLAMEPDMSEPLPAVALCEAGLAFVCLHLYDGVTEVNEHEDLF